MMNYNYRSYCWFDNFDSESNEDSPYVMSNLYFLQPYISSSEYKTISLRINDPRVPRYINPKMVLSLIK